MKRLILLTTTVLFALGACQPNPEPVAEPITEPEDNTEEVTRIIEQKNQSITDNLKKGIVDSMAVHFADNIVQMPPNMPLIEGIEAYKQFWEESITLGEWDLRLVTREVKVRDDIAVELGSYTLDLKAAEGAPMPDIHDEGNYVVMWELIDGDWKIVWDAPSSTVPFPTPESAP